MVSQIKNSWYWFLSEWSKYYLDGTNNIKQIRKFGIQDWDFVKSWDEQLNIENLFIGIFLCHARQFSCVNKIKVHNEYESLFFEFVSWKPLLLLFKGVVIVETNFLIFVNVWRQKENMLFKFTSMNSWFVRIYCHCGMNYL